MENQVEKSEYERDKETFELLKKIAINYKIPILYNCQKTNLNSDKEINND